MPAKEREVYLEFVRLGNVVRVTAICSVTGVEVHVMGPLSAARSDLERLAVRKLDQRIAAEQVAPLPERGGRGTLV
jgi:hypothetical protein